MNSKVKHGSKPASELQGIQFNEQFRKSMHSRQTTYASQASILAPKLYI